MLAVPTIVAEKHLKFASGDQIKVLLAFFKFSMCDDCIEQISDLVGLSVSVVSECLEYWALEGVLVAEGTEQRNPEPDKKKTPKPDLDDSATVLTRAETLKIADTPDFKNLFREVQNLIGRPLSFAQMQKLVSIYITYGLPISVILLAVNYCVGEGKTSFAYIEKVCIDWAENDINDLSIAEQKLTGLFMSNTAWSIVSSVFGINDRRPTAKERTFANSWVNEFKFKKEIIKLAYDKCVDANGKFSFPYIHKILESWHKENVKSVDDVRKLSENKNQGAKEVRKTSYDIEKIKKKVNDFDNIRWD